MKQTGPGIGSLNSNETPGQNLDSDFTPVRFVQRYTPTWRQRYRTDLTRRLVVRHSLNVH